MNRLTVIFAVIWYLCITLVEAQVAPDCSNTVPICNNTPVSGGTNDFKGAGKLQDSNTITIIPDREGDFEYRLDEGACRPGNKSYSDLSAMGVRNRSRLL